LIFSFALWAVCGACSTVFLIQAQAVLTQSVPDSRRAAVLGLASGGLQASQGLAVLAVGLLSQHVGVYWAVGGAGAAIAVLAVFLGLMWRRVRPGPEGPTRAGTATVTERPVTERRRSSAESQMSRLRMPGPSLPGRVVRAR
jgi:MFS family permease